MCQLLGMNCNTPTDISFSFEGFALRGGETDQHCDGWGISFFEANACRSFHDTVAACTSPVAEFIRNYPIKSLNVIAHIRKATIGEVNLQNTQPYHRELWGQQWAFAHNGDLWNYQFPNTLPAQPIGSSDSEAAFCHLMNTLRKKSQVTPLSAQEIYLTLQEESQIIAKFGTFNFLLTNGDYLFARCTTKLCYIIRKAPFSHAHLSDKDMSINFNEHTTKNDKVAVIATEPLTDNEEWTHFQNGELKVFQHGDVVTFE